MRLYHGTSSRFDAIDLSKGRIKCDFSKGFYTTTKKEQAESWSSRRSMLANQEPLVYVFEITKENLEGMKIKEFREPDLEWISFVVNNRSSDKLTHDYDIIIGPVADDNIAQTLALYEDNILTMEETLKRLKYSKPNNQVSFHTKRAVSKLRKVGEYSV